MGQQRYLVAVDSSLKRPGFAIFKITDDKAQLLRVSNVNNKTKKKTHGQILNEIKTHIEERILPYCKGPTTFVRQHAAPNHFNETALFEVIGLLNWQLFINKQRFFQDEWIEYYPVTVKLTVAGSGKADKEMVADALIKYVGNVKYECDDESDAVAVGLTHLIKTNMIKER